MNISTKSFILLLKELMLAVGYGQNQIDSFMVKLQKNTINLPTLVANVAVQCFIRKHSSPNADVIRSYLTEQHSNGTVKFDD